MPFHRNRRLHPKRGVWDKQGSKLQAASHQARDRGGRKHVEDKGKRRGRGGRGCATGANTTKLIPRAFPTLAAPGSRPAISEPIKSREIEAGRGSTCARGKTPVPAWQTNHVRAARVAEERGSNIAALSTGVTAEAEEAVKSATPKLKPRASLPPGKPSRHPKTLGIKGTASSPGVPPYMTPGSLRCGKDYMAAPPRPSRTPMDARLVAAVPAQPSRKQVSMPSEAEVEQAMLTFMRLQRARG